MSSSSSRVVRCVRTLSDVHRATTALWRRDMTVHQFLETKVFSPDNFPSLLALGISLSFLDFCGVLGWRYLQRSSTATAAATAAGTSTTAANTASIVSRRLTIETSATATTAAAVSRPSMTVPTRHPAYQFMGE